MISAKGSLAYIIYTACLCGTEDCEAASTLAFAKVNLVPAINIEQTAEIDFGTLHNVDGVCHMGNGGSLSGTSGMDCAGTETPGEFTVTGQDGASIVVSVTPGTANGITFTPALNGSPTRTLESGTAQIVVLGALHLNGASDGLNTISYTVTANYE